MAVGVVLKVKGASTDQYDKVLEKMGFRHGGHGAPGGLFHWITETEDGLVITDVWESKETFEKFAAEQIGPYMAEVGVTSQPEITYYDVYNYLTAGSAVGAAA